MRLRWRRDAGCFCPQPFSSSLTFFLLHPFRTLLGLRGRCPFVRSFAVYTTLPCNLSRKKGRGLIDLQPAFFFSVISSLTSLGCHRFASSLETGSSLPQIYWAGLADRFSHRRGTGQIGFNKYASSVARAKIYSLTGFTRKKEGILGRRAAQGLGNVAFF